MNEECTTAVANTAAILTMPPIACATWCDTGTGHTDRRTLEDQYCDAGNLEFELLREPPEQILPGGPYYRRAIVATLEQEPFSEPFVSTGVIGMGVVKLNLDEAERYATHLLGLVALATGAP